MGARHERDLGDAIGRDAVPVETAGAADATGGASPGGLSPFYDTFWLDLLREYEDVCAALEAAYRTDDDDAND